MLNFRKGSLDAAKAEQYYQEKYSVDDYYTEKQQVVGQWVGKLAGALGLTGNVAHEDFSALLQGIDPHSGAVLVEKALGYGVHAAGWDGTFNAPKSVSIQALTPGGDPRLIEVHKIAVARAVAAIEKYAQARMYEDGTTVYVTTSNVLGAAFMHIAARPVEKTDHGPDMHVHTHLIFLNMTRRGDGQIRALSPIEIYRAQRLGSAVYRTELAKEVQKIGYGTEVTTSYGAWELEGYTRKQVMAFSSRRREMEAEMDEQRVGGPEAAQRAAINTRQAKQHYDQTALKAEWGRRAAEAGIDVSRHYQQALRNGDIRQNDALEIRKAVEFAVEHLSNREAVISRRDLLTVALQRCMGNGDLAAVEREITRLETAQQLFYIAPNYHYIEGAYTTDNQLALEQENIGLMQQRRDTYTAPIASREEVQKWALSKGLSVEQTNAALMALSSVQGVLAIEGYAGTGKTTLLKLIQEFAEEHGYLVHGIAVTSGAVKALQEAGIKAETVASFLGKPRPMPTGPELLFADESSLISTHDMNRILKEAYNLGIERVDFIGDQAQHQSVESGSAMRQLLAEGMPVATLQDIRRQKDPELREAVKVARGDGAAALDMLTEQGRVIEIPDVQERYQRIAAEYLAGLEAGQNTLVVSPANQERRDLNQVIRQALIEHGKIGNTGRRHDVLVRRDMTPAQIRHAGSYEVGDIIYAVGDRQQQRQGIRKNSTLTVEAVNRKLELLTLKTQDGRRFEACPAKWADREHSYAEVFKQENRTIACGDRIQFRHPLKKYAIANGEFATVIGLGNETATLCFRGERPRELTLPLAAMRHVDYGFAVTSFSSQGSTCDLVLINDDSMRSDRLVNREQLYVSASRGRHDVRVFTDDAQHLRQSVARDPKKAIALEAVKQPAPKLEPQPQITVPAPQQRQSQSVGMRM